MKLVGNRRELSLEVVRCCRRQFNFFLSFRLFHSQKPILFQSQHVWYRSKGECLWVVLSLSPLPSPTTDNPLEPLSLSLFLVMQFLLEWIWPLQRLDWKVPKLVIPSWRRNLMLSTRLVPPTLSSSFTLYSGADQSYIFRSFVAFPYNPLQDWWSET